MKLLTKQNAKTIKGEKYGYETHVLYMAPHKQNSLNKNLCAFASKGCADACLYTAGRGRMPNVQKARIRKADYFIKDRSSFMLDLYNEINKINKKKSSLTPCIRLNGTTDIPWEGILYKGKSIMSHFPNIQFYDYTKSIKRLINNKIDNYHLTFSKSESNDAELKLAYYNNKNIAIVVTPDIKEKLLIDKIYSGKVSRSNYNRVDGDQHDLIFKHPKKSIVLLKAKGDALKDNSGFVIKDYNEFLKKLI